LRPNDNKANATRGGGIRILDGTVNS
jgi:hypothetical protein